MNYRYDCECTKTNQTHILPFNVRGHVPLPPNIIINTVEPLYSKLSKMRVPLY